MANGTLGFFVLSNHAGNVIKSFMMPFLDSHSQRYLRLSCWVWVFLAIVSCSAPSDPTAKNPSKGKHQGPQHSSDESEKQGSQPSDSEENKPWWTGLSADEVDRRE